MKGLAEGEKQAPQSSTASSPTYQSNALISVDGSLWDSWRHWMRVTSWTQVRCWLHEALVT